MKKSQRLAPVLHLEEMKEQVAIKNYTAMREQLLQETDKLQQLIDYSQEYQVMVQEEGRTGISGERLQSYHHFLNRLATAVSQQQLQVSSVKQQLQESEQHWLKQRGATKNMDSLITRYATSERLAADKREQREQDENIQRSYKNSALIR